MAITVEEVFAPGPDVERLIAGLEQDLSPHYAPNQRHGLPLAAIFQPHIRFFLAHRDGEAMACGGVALFPGFAEIKRMYVVPMARGHGLADAVMTRLSQAALEADRALLRLETGDKQLAGIRFYQRCGFQPCAAFAPYCDMPAADIATSIFMEKLLA